MKDEPKIHFCYYFSVVYIIYIYKLYNFLIFFFKKLDTFPSLLYTCFHCHFTLVDKVMSKFSTILFWNSRDLKKKKFFFFIKTVWWYPVMCYCIRQQWKYTWLLKFFFKICFAWSLSIFLFLNQFKVIIIKGKRERILVATMRSWDQTRSRLSKPTD